MQAYCKTFYSRPFFAGVTGHWEACGWMQRTDWVEKVSTVTVI